jgi:vacuolar-type H+-ATPase subunit H
MAWPQGARDEPRAAASSVRLGPLGHLEVAPGVAAAADARLESVCSDLGILLARHVEPVSVRVLPFGDEQLAMVQVLDTSAERTQLHAATGRGASASEAVAGAAVRAMTGGHNVLEAALPGAVADGKVRSAVVFSEGDAPVRWGGAGDEARLAALYAVIPQLGSFTATTGTDTYRVLRLPGIGVALVSEGASAAAWVEGWFAALLHATQFALRSTQRSTSVVATSPVPDDRAGRDESRAGNAPMVEHLEEEARRILQAAQDQAAEIRAAAERDAVRWREVARRDDRGAGDSDRHRDHEPHERAPRLDDAARESERLLRDAERTRDRLLSDARREVDALRRETERACESLLADTRRESEELRRETERTRTAMITDANRHAAELRRDAEQARRDAETLRAAPRATRDDVRGDVLERRQRPDDVIREARRAADDLLHDARRTAEEIVRDATRERERLLDEHARLARASREDDSRNEASHAWARDEPRTAATPEPATRSAAPPTPTAGQAAPSAEEARLAAMALLSAAAESIAAMSVILGRAADVSGGERAPESPAQDPFADVPGLFFGA